MRTDYLPISTLRSEIAGSALRTDDPFAEAITKTASKQTYYTIRFLADGDRVQDAYRAYAYFRWVDDSLDQRISDHAERLAFIEHQQALVNRLYEGKSIYDLLPEEEILVRLINSDVEENSGLHTYIRSMMKVMSFDASRRGRLISQTELRDYSHHLAVGVTEALHYCIGHDDAAPRIVARYAAVTGAHVTHMLRDTFEDVNAGYFNIPCEFLEAHRADPCDLESVAYRVWVESRVRLARDYFEAGKDYLARVQNRRCRLAGFAYIVRFESVLNVIEQDGYRLRAQYRGDKRLSSAVSMGISALSMLFASGTRSRA